MISLTLDLPIRAALLELESLRIAEVGGGDEVFAAFEACGSTYADRYAGQGPGAVEGIASARELFRALGIDPTKRRPSSEALLNRALKGKPLPRINTLVDVGNWWSLEHLLPMGLYDRRALRGDIVLRRGAPGDAYLAITGRELDLDGRYLLADDEGPFGSPITDSKRTAVSETTDATVMVLYAPPSYPRDRLETAAQVLASRVEASCGGRRVGIELHGC